MVPFVSRAGAKLEFALKEFQVDVSGKICADLGCSTGGFTDCLLRHQAARVFSVDTGYGVLDYKLRLDPRVTVMERTNALHLKLPQPVDFISIDVGWTRQSLILPPALNLLSPGGQIISLVKPHYEAQKGHLSSAEAAEVFPGFLTIFVGKYYSGKDCYLAGFRRKSPKHRISDFTFCPLNCPTAICYTKKHE